MLLISSLPSHHSLTNPSLINHYIKHRNHSFAYPTELSFSHSPNSSSLSTSTAAATLHCVNDPVWMNKVTVQESGSHPPRLLLPPYAKYHLHQLSLPTKLKKTLNLRVWFFQPLIFTVFVLINWLFFNELFILTPFFRPCNVSDVLVDLVGAAQPLAQKQRRNVELSEFSKVLQVVVEEAALRQALGNLIEGGLLRTRVGRNVQIVSVGASAGGALVVIDGDGPDMHYMQRR